MNGALATTLIGITGGGIITLLVVLFRTLFNLIAMMNTRFNRVDERFDRVDERFDRVDDKFDRVDDKFEGLEQKVDNNTAAIKDLEIRLTEKFTSQLREHGERLARIEAKLDIDPPAEAA